MIPKELEHLAEEARKYRNAEEFIASPDFEYHLSSDPDLVGKTIEGEEAFTTKTPHTWSTQLQYEREEKTTPDELYLVWVDTPSEDFSGYYGHETVSHPDEVNIIEKIGNIRELFGDEPISISDVEVIKEQYLKTFWEIVQKKEEEHIPPIRKPSLEYEVELINSKVLKCPKRGFEFKVKTDYNILKNLGDLAPLTEYDEKRNCLIQEAVKGRFATEEELVQVCKLIRKKGYAPRGILSHDVIITPEGKFKVIDVGHFEKIKEATTPEEKENIKKEIIASTIKRECLTDNERCTIAKEIMKDLF